MARVITRMLLCAGIVLGTGHGASAEGWLLANKCRHDDCYLKWVKSVSSTIAGVYDVRLETLEWKASDDPPAYGDYLESFSKVSCRPGEAFVEVASGQRVNLPAIPPLPPDDDLLSLWSGVCKGVRELTP